MPSMRPVAHRAFGVAAFGRQVAAAIGADARAACADRGRTRPSGTWSAPRPSCRDCANTSVFSPALIAMRAMRLLCERADARRPRSGLTTGGFHSSTCLSPVGAPDSVIACTSRLDQRLGVVLRVADRRRAQDELRRRAVERAHALAAGAARWPRASRTRRGSCGSRRSRRSCRFSKNCAHLVWCGRIALVQHVRIADHDVAVAGGSPGARRRACRRRR